MPTAIKMPKLGMTMREGRVLEWRAGLGDYVEKGSVLLLIESEKAEVEVEATASGYLRHIYVEPDTTVPCGALLGALTETADEPFDAERFRATHDTPEVAAVGAAGSAATAGPGAAASPAPERPGASGRRRPVAPAARVRARELGVDLDAVVGTGPGGRVTRADVEAYAASLEARVEVAPGIRLEVLEEGAGPPVLLLPGFGADAASFAPQIAAWTPRYRVRVLHPRGVGASDASGRDPITPRAVARDAGVVAGDCPCHVVGASFGAAAAAELALARPDLVRSLTLITPSFEPSDRLLAVLTMWTRLLAQASAEVAAIALLPWLFSGAYLADGRAADRAARGLAAMMQRTRADALGRYVDGLRVWSKEQRPDVSLIATPTLVVAAGDDLLTPNAAEVADAIPGARLEGVPRAGHAVTLEAGKEVADAILRYWAAIEREGGAGRNAGSNRSPTDPSSSTG